MGLDAILYATGDLTLNQDAAWWPDQCEHRDGRVYRDTWQRFYGPAYPRGDWPILARELGELRDAFPKATIIYTDDHSESAGHPGREVTPALLEELWELWRTKGNEEGD